MGETRLAMHDHLYILYYISNHISCICGKYMETPCYVGVCDAVQVQTSRIHLPAHVRNRRFRKITTVLRMRELA